MRIQFLAHSSFLITTDSGTRIVTDPFDPGAYPDKMLYGRFDGSADVVTISHDHKDHGRADMVGGSPIVIKGNGKFLAKDVEFMGVGTYHDDTEGSQRGRNTVFVITADGLRVAHLGDLGHVLTSEQAAEIGNVDVALVPVGGYYTIDAKQAETVSAQLDANIVIPMHYRTDKCLFPIAAIEEFIADKPNVTLVGGSAVEITAEDLSTQQQIVVLDHEL